uniref:Larval cuticle protein LCP-17 n=2 Tax=Lygus hesperus TaxID=30085 RepID=A0A0K8SLT1_LYGHE
MILTTAAVLSTLLVLSSALPQQQYNRPQPFGAPAPIPSRQAAPAPLAAAPGVNPLAAARTIRQEQDNQFDGTFSYSFETDNGIQQNAQGSVKNPGTEQEAQVVQGSYSYTSPEGQVVTITYIADEEGFKAQGDAIPTTPPLPEAIARALEYIRSIPPDPSQKL